jgi:o-succinylbenzoate---CoA ligase
MNLRDRLSMIPDDWLLGLNHSELLREIDRASLKIKPHHIVLIAETDSLKFVAAFFAAVMCHAVVILANPHWREQEWGEVSNIMKPDVVFGSVAIAPSVIRAALQPGDILIPTGGTSGQIRFAIHSWDTLTASVLGFQQHFEIDAINSCCVLPLYHVSGLMQLLRSLMTTGQFVLHDWKKLEAGKFPAIDRSRFFLSLVPTQLQRLIHCPELSEFQAILLGGAPAWESLLTECRSRQFPIAPTYGMTETASQIATLKPQAFLQGQTGCGSTLPHAIVTIRDNDGDALPTGTPGVITVQSKSLMRGYFPPAPFAIDDIGYFDNHNSLHIIGRNSQKIISGGENLYPAEIEAAIRSTGLVEDICVIGIPDEQWGEIAVAFYVSQEAVEVLKGAIASLLSKLKQPKRWVAVEAIPRTVQGKVVRSRLPLNHQKS